MPQPDERLHEVFNVDYDVDKTAGHAGEVALADFSSSQIDLSVEFHHTLRVA